ncbi:ABC transporter ATP-binding protein [Rhodococcus sp. T2V]|uniref:ABC transporter ATP-binding protein n=1 Tax=Rhodococcus sp. T2V TaxID=3034164 RepID=UPI0023E33649|nr:ABC transporter ATP-binding protein [Rhodococcus sp. T2V]MDF3312217.1 ABC transporter ATP-binding protein [Rhodococcus sp. T2V]
MTLAAPQTSTNTPLIELKGVSKTFPVRQGLLQRVRAHVHAVSDISLQIYSGESVGLVGESGSGKSTLGRLAMRLLDPSSGTVHFEGTDVTNLHGSGLRTMRAGVQTVFQDPFGAFNPLLPLRTSVSEPLQVHRGLSKGDCLERLRELIPLVGLSLSHLERYPRELSGGQLQRMAIARALAVEPRLLVLDEPISALDVSTQAQVINLLEELQRKLGVAYLLIAHNPALVRHASDRIAVMYLGEVVEIGDAGDVYDHPRHPYTQALLSAVTVPDPDAQRTRQRIILQGDIPNPADPPPGCRFHTRCPYTMDICRIEPPPQYPLANKGAVRCHLHTVGALEGRPVAELGMPTVVTSA